MILVSCRGLAIALVLFLLVAPAHAQIRITFTQQGAEVIRTVGGHRIKGVGICAVTAQNVGPSQRSLQAQEVYAAAAKTGISYISPSLANAILSRNSAKSKPQIVLDAMTIASSVTGTLGITKTIAMPNGIAAGLSLAPMVIPLIQHFLTAQLPQPGIVQSHLLEGSWKLDPLGMIPDGMLMMARFQGNWEPKEVEIQ